MKRSGTESEEKKNEKESLEQAIQRRIEELSLELQEKMQLKEMCKKTIVEIDTRITQVTSAVHELNSILKTHLESTHEEASPESSLKDQPQ